MLLSKRVKRWSKTWLHCQKLSRRRREQLWISISNSRARNTGNCFLKSRTTLPREHAEWRNHCPDARGIPGSWSRSPSRGTPTRWSRRQSKEWSVAGSRIWIKSFRDQYSTNTSSRFARSIHAKQRVFSFHPIGRSMKFWTTYPAARVKTKHT